MHEATRRIEWDMGHRVPLHGGKCKTPHGHRYAAEITVRGEVTREGFVLDFAEIKRLVGGWIDDQLDHTTAYQRGDAMMTAISAINDATGLKPFFVMAEAPTAENLAWLIGLEAKRLLAGFVVVEVKVWETPNCSATWRP
jgi:6-pyruvoyltetrahydropterin/6-carboxytetrahydropterin synthase